MIYSDYQTVEAAPHEDFILSDVAPAEMHIQEIGFLPRSKMLWVPFLIPILFCGLSTAAGGIPAFTDVGFIALTLICLTLVGNEFFRFPRRYGIGGFVLFGGVLIWFCHDYFSHWLGADFTLAGPDNIQPDVVARAAFLYMVFVLFMVVGLNMPPWPRVERFLLSAPEPASPNLYLFIVLAMFALAMSAFVFTADNFFVSIAKNALSPWMGEVAWTAGRTGNYNYSWGAYLAQFLEVGALGGIVAVLYAVFVTKSIFQRIFCWTIWLYWCLGAYATGRRGPLAFETMPALGFLFLKYQDYAAAQMKRQSIRAYVFAGAIAIVLLTVVQIQGTFRGAGGLGANVDISQVNLTESQGNLMFTEALTGFALIPDSRPFFCDTFPGEGAIRALPETAMWFVIGPIPRALWNSKPSDPMMIWYNKTVAGTDGMEGTTIATGIVGHWYFRYGFFGMIEGALLLGWLMGLSERILQGAAGRPMTIMIALCLAAWLFREYRSFIFIELYGPLIGLGVFIIVVKITRAFGGANA